MMTLNQQIEYSLDAVRWERAEPFLDDLDVEGIYRTALESRRGGAEADLAVAVEGLDCGAADALIARIWPHTSASGRSELLADERFRRRLICEAIDRRAAEDGRRRIGDGVGNGITLSPPSALRRWHLDVALADQLDVDRCYQALRRRGSTGFDNPRSHACTGLPDQQPSLLQQRADSEGVRVKVGPYRSPDSPPSRTSVILREEWVRAELFDVGDRIWEEEPYAHAAAAKHYYDLRRGLISMITYIPSDRTSHERLMLARLEEIAAIDGYHLDAEYDRGWPWIYVNLVPADPLADARGA